ncbi:MAG: hypothetical protein HYX33_03180 [Actinobacteria bacterium]|nr:hypothetical protein [Actinomycetota bacterium]
MARLTPPLPVRGVRIEPGAFTDRLQLEGLRIERGPRPVVRGRLRGMVDVSEFLVLEVRAAFYDRRGSLVGSGRQVWSSVLAGPADAPVRLAIRPTREAPTAVAAVVSVPQLVNE